MESVQTQQERDRQTRLERRRQQERERRARETPEERDRRRSLRNQRDRERRRARCAARCASALAQLERVCTCIIIRIRIYIRELAHARPPMSSISLVCVGREQTLCCRRRNGFLQTLRCCARETGDRTEKTSCQNVGICWRVQNHLSSLKAGEKLAYVR